MTAQKKIEKQFHIHLDQKSNCDYEFYRPHKELSIDYHFARIESDVVLWNAIKMQLSKQYVHSENIQMGWDLPEGYELTWWHFNRNHNDDAIFSTFDTGWIQGIYKDNFIYLMKTTN